MGSPPIFQNRWFRFYAVHEVLLGNALAMIFGDWMTGYLFTGRFGSVPESKMHLYQVMDSLFFLFAVLVISALVIWYETPARRCLKDRFKGKAPDPELLDICRRRVLNVPYFIVVVDGIVWTAGTLLFSFLASPTGILTGMGTGMITMTLAFLWIEHSAQHTRIPLFFPQGDLSGVKGVKSMSLRERIAVLILAASVVPLAFILMTIYRFRRMRAEGVDDFSSLMEGMERLIVTETVVFLGVAAVLTFLVIHHLKPPLEELIRGMGNVKQGDFKQRARVFTNDEIGLAAETLNAMNKGLEEREMIRDTFGKFVDRRIRDEILSGRVTLDGELKNATILFSDLRDFTPLVAVTPARQLTYMLNAYLDEMAKAIDSNGGLILQFIGDEIEAVFGAPVAKPGHEKDALETAFEMDLRLERLNQRFEKEGIPAMAHGIGIHTGPVLAARIGSAQRAAYSLIGDTVNMASRIQGLNKTFKTQILVSREIRDALDGKYRFHSMPETRVKGRQEPIRVFEPRPEKLVAETGVKYSS